MQGFAYSAVMGRRVRAAAHLVRDAVVIVFSVLLIATTQGSEEMAATLLQGLSAVFIALSVVDIVLVVLRRRARGFFLGNAAYQVAVSLLLTGLYPPAGVPILALNVFALVSLREKKTAEELALHPPLPRTRNYKVLAGVGTVVMAASTVLPWVGTDATVSLLGVYSGIFGYTSLPGGVTVSPVGVVFAMLTLFLSLPALALGVMSLRWRKLSLVGGAFGLLGGGGIVLAVTSAASVGAYAFAAGGALLLAANVGFRKR